MRISLIVPTRNRAKTLPQLFAAINALECSDPFEVIIVDSCSTDDTLAVLRDLASRAVVPVRVAHEPIAGAGRARNAGFRLAQSELVAFTDDDCYPHPTYLQCVIECFDEEPSLGFVGGRVLLFDPTDCRTTIKESEEREAIPPRAFIRPGIIHGANFAFRREAFESVGGFDHHLGPGTPFVCEDTDILARTSDAGWHGVYDPRPVVYHHHRRKTPEDARRLRKVYDRGRGAYFVKGLLHLSVRKLVFKHWYWNLRDVDWDVGRRELTSACRYLLTRGLASRRQGSLRRS